MTTPLLASELIEWDRFLLETLLNLIDICDSFDQLGKIAVLCDHLYDPTDPEHPILFKALEKTARYLQKKPNIGRNEFKPACNAPGCPCPIPCATKGVSHEN